MSYISNYDYVYGMGYIPNRQVIFTRERDNKDEKICAEVFPLLNGKADKEHSLGKFTEDEIGIEDEGSVAMLKWGNYSVRNIMPLSYIFPPLKEAILKNLHRVHGRRISIESSPACHGENYEKVVKMTLYDPR